jgi:hypothetical protein
MHSEKKRENFLTKR